MKKLLPRFFFSPVFIVSSFFSVMILSIILFFSLTNIAYAQLNGCGSIDVGNPPANITPPSQCAGSGVKGWPFPTKNPSQFNRIDQGWDLEYNKPTDVLAVADGTMNINHGPNACQGGIGFGDDYPIEVLDKPVTIQGRKYTAIYYGHIHHTTLGHVKAGAVIGHTYQCVIDHGVWLNWLEIGFWSVGPVGQGAPSTAGYDMEEYLNGTRKGNANAF